MQHESEPSHRDITACLPEEHLAARQEQGAQSRQRILDAAERLVGERGYTAASMSLISRASGLPASSIYWHFGSEEELPAAVVEVAVGRATGEHPDFLRVLMVLALDGREGAPRAR